MKFPGLPPRRSTWSLYWRLAAICGFAMLGSIVVGGIAMYWAGTIHDDEALDARLEHIGATILSFVEKNLRERGWQGKEEAGRSAFDAAAMAVYRYQVWSKDGTLVARSQGASPSARLMPPDEQGFADSKSAETAYRVFSQVSNDGQFIVQVAESLPDDWNEIVPVAGYYVASLLLPFAIIYWLTLVLIRRSLASVEAIALQLADRNPQDLTPLDIENPPRELLPTLKSVDTLFARVHDALSAERRFTSVAAHEMRTPLAGLRAQAQWAGMVESAAELDQALKALLAGVDRATHTLDQLLDLARIEGLPSADAVPFEAVSLPMLHDAVMELIGAKGRDKQVTVRAEFKVERVQAHYFSLFLIFRNLISNALLYTPEGGELRVASFEGPEGLTIWFDDTGPGIPEPHHELAFERFNRLGRTSSLGVGLGLSIVLAAVELHGAKIRLLESPAGGLRVQIVLRPGRSDSTDDPTPSPRAVETRGA